MKFIWFALFSLLFLINFVYATGGNVIVGYPITFNSLIPSSNPIVIGSTQTLTAYTYNGIGPYAFTYNVYARNGMLLDTIQYSGVLTNTNSVSYTQATAWGLGEFKATVNVIDSAYSPGDAEGSTSYEVIAQTFVVTEWQLNPKLYQGQNQLLNATIPFDANSPYAYNWLVYAPNNMLMYNSLNIGKSLTNNQTIFEVGNWVPGIYTEDILVSDSSGNIGSNSLSLEVLIPGSGGTSGIILLPLDNNESYFALLLFVFAILLFLIRILIYKKESMSWPVVDILSALFMFLAAYYYVFAPVSNISGTMNISGSPIAISIANQEGISVSAPGFILLWITVIFYIMIMLILAMRDFLAARHAAGMQV